MKHNSENGIAGPERRPERQATRGVTDDGLSDTQVMTTLERRRAAGTKVEEQTLSHVPVLRPEDTGTRLALKKAVEQGAPVAFAVQLRWSAQPIDVDCAPRDPIFRSYTLYTIRSRRDGREWFELRLGFFADAISAKQVAHYMRSEYDSAAVVPVNPQEKAALEASMNAARAVGHRPAPEMAATAAAAAAAPTAAAAVAAVPPAKQPSPARASWLSVIRSSGARRA
jgi:hypothetical protein